MVTTSRSGSLDLSGHPPLSLSAMRSRRIAVYLIMVCLTTMTIWAAIAKVDVVATAPGRIVPQGLVKPVQSALPGQVSQILVENGDRVIEGTPLINLESAVASAEIDRLEWDLMGARLARSWRQAVLQDDDNREFVPPENAPPGLVEVYRRLLLSRLTEKVGDRLRQDATREQLVANIAAIENEIERARKQIPVLGELVEIQSTLNQKGLGTRLKYLDAETKLIDARYDLTLNERRLVEARHELESFDANRLSNSGAFARHILSEIAEADRRIIELSSELVRARELLERHVIRAPVAGTVDNLRLQSPQAVIAAGEQLLTIVPDDARLEIEAFVSDRDIGFVSPGMPVDIKIKTFPYTRYGSLTGSLLSVSSDAVGPGQQVVSLAGASGQPGFSLPDEQGPWFKARIALDQTEVTVEHRRISLKPGTTVIADIQTSGRTVLDFLMTPLLRYRYESFRER